MKPDFGASHWGSTLTILDALKLLRLTMGNPASRAIVRLGDLGQIGGTSRLELALKSFAFNEGAGSFIDHAYFVALKALLSIGCQTFSTKIDSIREYLKDPIVRRAVASVLGSIAFYGITRPQLLKAPFLVVWNFTNACNLRCKHCYQDAGRKSSEEMSTRKKLDVVEELAGAGVVSIAFSGGEPLVNPDFFSVARVARDNGMHVALATNGTAITSEIAGRLKEIDVCYVEVSLDAVSPELHDSFRGVPGSHSRSLKGIRNCVKEGIFTGIATTITKYNLKEVRELIILGRSMKVDRFIHFNFIPTGRGRGKIQLDISPTEREELLRILFAESQVPGIEILSTAPQFGRLVSEMSCGGFAAPTHFYVGKTGRWGLRELAQFIGGCGAGRLYCAIQPDGRVTPCVFMPGLIVGNLRTSRFEEIWHGSRVLRELRSKDLLKPACGECENRYVCGGCRARSLGYFLDYLGPDPGCIKNINAWEELKERLHERSI